MKRMAFLVEGYSEMQFVDRLIVEIAGANNVVIEQKQVRGGRNVEKSITTISASSTNTSARYYVLILDCGGEDLVKSRLLEEHENLTNAGYQKIICIRDVRPKFAKADIPRLKVGLKMYVKGSLAPVEFILSTMELEAWFLAEFNHYPAIDPAITPIKIKELIGYDPVNDDPSDRNAPSDDLDKCYSIAGHSYKKSDISRTINALDFTYIYTGLIERIPEIKTLTCHIDDFLCD